MGIHADQFSPVLGCGWWAWRYVGPGTVALEVPAGHRPEIRGTTRTAEALLHGVRRVEVLARVFERQGRGWRTTFDKGEVQR